MAWFQRQVVPYLQVCRFAAVFTAIADIAAGLALTGRLQPWQVSNLWLLLATVGLYLAGMAWNDYFDRAIDAVERPRRPIPSGRVSLAGARRFATGLMLLGGLAAAGAAWQTGQRGPVLVAGLLTGAILWYDVSAKNHAWGPLVMGLCRFLNLLLGASLGLSLGTAVWETARQGWGVDWLPWPVAAGNGLYIVGVTLFSRNEAGQSPRGKLVRALVVANFGLLLLGVTHAFWPREPGVSTVAGRWGALLLWGMIAALINRVAWGAIQNPAPQPVQLTIRTMLTSLILLDALVVLQATTGPWWALGVLLLRYPAQWIGRRLAIT
jgi:4-hydroxybenzoate polyprenyltransferase